MMKETEEITNFDVSKVLVLDTVATFHSVMNESLLTGIYTPKTQLEMCTNTGERILTQRGELLKLQSDPWLDEEPLANIISF